MRVSRDGRARGSGTSDAPPTQISHEHEGRASAVSLSALSRRRPRRSSDCSFCPRVLRATVRHRRAGATEAPAGCRVTARDARRANPAETRVARLGRRLRQEREEGGRPLHPRAGEEEIQAFGRARWRSRRSRRSWRSWRTRRPRRETRERRSDREQGARGRFEPGVGPSPPTGRFRSPRRARPRSAHFGCPRRRRRFAVRFSATPSLTDLSPLVPRLPQFAQAKNRIASQMSVIRQQLSMIEAYDMDGWKGARYAVSPRSRVHDAASFDANVSHERRIRRGVRFSFLASLRASASPFDALTKPKHAFARPRTAAARNSAPPLRSRRRARRSSTPSSASESCSRLWISRSRTRTPRRSLKNPPSTPTTKPPPPPPPRTTRTRASTRRTFSAPPAARATRTTTTTSCCATGSARARTTCPAWTRR